MNWLILIFLGIAWGLTFPLSKIAAVSGGSPLGLTFWQNIVSGLILLVFVIWKYGGLKIDRSLYKFILVVTFLAGIFPNVILYTAAFHLDAGVLSISVSVVPMFTYILALCFGLDKLGLSRCFGLIVGFIALLILLLPENSLPERSDVPWVLLSLLCALFYALENIYIDKIKPENENNLNISLDIEYIAFDDIHDKLDLNTRENTNHINLQDFLEKIPDKVTSQNDKVTFQNSDLANILNSKGTAGDLLKVNKDPALNEVVLLKPLDDFINDKNLKSFDDFLSNDTANYLSIENKGFEGNLILNETIKKHENNSSKLIVGKNISDKNYKNEIDMLSKWSNHLSKNSNLNDETIKLQKSSLDIKTPGNINEDKIALNTFLSLKTDIKSSGKKNPLTNFPYSREFVKGAKYNNDLMIKTLSENDLKFSNPQTFVKDLNIDLENYEIKSSKKEIELSKISLLQPAKHFKNNLNLIRELTSSEIKFVSFKEDGNSLFKDNNISTPSTISEVRQNTQLGQQLTQNTDLTFNASKELQTHLHKQVINQLWKIGQIGQSRAILELEPKELGKVLVTLEMNKGQDGIKVILQTETQQAAQVLQQDASKLRQLYASFGIDLQDFHASKDAGGGNGKSYHDKEKSNVDDKLDTKSIKVKSGVKERNIIGKLDILA